MESKVNLSLVGVFVIVLTMTMVAGGLWLASGSYKRKTYDTYETYMTESVSGLSLNSSVRYRGVEVGHVRDVGLAPGNVEQVRVRLDIERGTPIKTDTVASLQTQGLTGISYVELSGGRKDSPALKVRPGQEVPVIEAAPSLFGRLETVTPVLLANLTSAVGKMNSLLDEPNRAALSATLADLSTVARTAASRASTIDSALAGSAIAMQNAARASARLPALIERLERTADSVMQMAAGVSAASDAVGTTLDAARGTLSSVRETVDGSRESVDQLSGFALPEARELITELRDLAGSMRRTVEEIERNPSLLVQGRRPPKRGPGE